MIDCSADSILALVTNNGSPVFVGTWSKFELASLSSGFIPIQELPTVTFMHFGVQKRSPRNFRINGVGATLYKMEEL